MWSLISKPFQFLKEAWYQHQCIFDSMETEVVPTCLPPVLMNTQNYNPNYSKADLAGGGKIKRVLPSQRPGSVGFLRNQPMVLEKISWQVTALPTSQKILPLTCTLPALSSCLCWSSSHHLLLQCSLGNLLCSLSHVSSFEWLLLTPQPSSDSSSDGQMSCDPCLWQCNPPGMVLL